MGRKKKVIPAELIEEYTAKRAALHDYLDAHHYRCSWLCEEYNRLSGKNVQLCVVSRACSRKSKSYAGYALKIVDTLCAACGIGEVKENAET